MAQWETWDSGNAVLHYSVDVLKVPGYTHRIDREWSYSEKVYDMLADYIAKYEKASFFWIIFFQALISVSWVET